MSTSTASRPRERYRYTRLATDGTTSELCVRETQMSVDELQQAVGGLFALVDRDYYVGKSWCHAQATVWADDEGRLKGLPRNTHFHSLAPTFYIVGDCILEERLPS